MKPRILRSGCIFGAGVVVLLLNPCAKLIPPAMADCVDYESYVHVAGTGAIDFTPVDMVVSGPWIFTAAGSSGLRVIDITDPVSPVVVGQAGVPSYA
jgi:hypothetical protein